jgi:malonyl-CoA O-methyltransferase
MGDTFRPSYLPEIGKNFSKACDSYRKWALPQRETALELLRFARPHLSGGVALDAGAGVGLLTELLEGLFEKVFACDLSEKSLKRNSAASRRAFLCNMERLPLKTRSVDWAFSSFALHWCDWKRAIKELKRVARRGVAFAVPVEGSLKGLGFPFPPAEEVLKEAKPTAFEILIEEIPFRGRDFLLFFKKTGTGFNPNKKLSAFEILKNPNRVGFYGFKVLLAVVVF